MSTVVLSNRLDVSSAANTALNAAARFWLAVSLIGQWAFLYYIVAFYGPSTFMGDFQAWTRNRFLIKGYVPGDTPGNLVFAAHALLAGVIAFGGALQLIPRIRSRWMSFHRWNGRAFIATSLLVSLTGLWMVWVRGAKMSTPSAIAVSINGVLIIVFAVLAWRTARSHDVSAHRRWALRTYMVANGQWFIRIGMIAWMMINRGRDGGFFQFWNFGCYLFPLLVLELYLHTKEKAGSAARFAMAGGLAVLTLLMGFGIFGLSMFLWQQILAKF